MRKSALFGLVVISGFMISGCENKTQTGALAGAGLGATTGAIISHSAGGALIGGAIGAAGGALIGSALDQQDREIMRQQSPQTLQRIDSGQQLTIRDIKDMNAAGIKDQVIISQIEATRSTFNLSSREIIDLKDAGVSQHVIDAMIRGGNR
jgi:outer membrane lipoprotein SlyB